MLERYETFQVWQKSRYDSIVLILLTIIIIIVLIKILSPQICMCIYVYKFVCIMKQEY